MVDGHLNKCKKCCKAYEKRRRNSTESRKRILSMTELYTDYHRFEELLAVLDEEELVRFAYRLRRRTNTETADLLDDARREREAAHADELGQGIVGR
jgi:hypothetical protein